MERLNRQQDAFPYSAVSINTDSKQNVEFNWALCGILRRSIRMIFSFVTFEWLNVTLFSHPQLKTRKTLVHWVESVKVSPVSKVNDVRRISRYQSELLRKQKNKYISFYSLSLEAIILSLTLVLPSQQSIICPGLLSDTDLSFVMIRSNTRPLTFSSLYLSVSTPIRG